MEEEVTNFVESGVHHWWLFGGSDGARTAADMRGRPISGLEARRTRFRTKLRGLRPEAVEAYQAGAVAALAAVERGDEPVPLVAAPTERVWFGIDRHGFEEFVGRVAATKGIVHAE